MEWIWITCFGIAMLYGIDIFNNIIEYFFISGSSDDKKDKK